MSFEFIFSEILWGVALWRFIVAIFIIFLGFAARRVILAVFRGTLAKKAEATDVLWDDELVKFMPAPLAALAQIGIWFGAMTLLQLPKAPVDANLWVKQGLTAALWVAGAWLTFRLVDVLGGAMARASEKTESRLDDQLIPLVRKTLKFIIAVTIGIMAAQNLGYSVTSLLASLGVGGLALALAAKDTVANLFGSVVVFADRPFQIGDWVQFGDVEGTVEEVGFRTTRIRRFDKSLVTVPNAQFSSTSITNHSHRNMRRIVMNIGVTYETKSGQVRQLLDKMRALVASHPGLDQGFNFVHFTEFGESALNMQIYCFTESTAWIEFLTVREELMLAIMDTVEELGLEMAFHTQTLYLRDERWPDKAA